MLGGVQCVILCQKRLRLSSEVDECKPLDPVAGGQAGGCVRRSQQGGALHHSHVQLCFR